MEQLYLFKVRAILEKKMGGGGEDSLVMEQLYLFKVRAILEKKMGGGGEDSLVMEQLYLFKVRAILEKKMGVGWGRQHFFLHLERKCLTTGVANLGSWISYKPFCT